VSDEGQKAGERALDLLVYAPVGVALYLRDTVPTFVNLFVSRGRSELGQRRRQAKDQVSQAKALGEFAVGFGGPKVREHVEKGIAMARMGAGAVLNGVTGEGSGGATDSPAPSARPTAQPESTPGPAATTTPAPPGPDKATLVIPDYDELSASQVVERLDGLQHDELDAVRAYEEAHRSRRTILFKIEQLTS
jgi:hypothetical protein